MKRRLILTAALAAGCAHDPGVAPVRAEDPPPGLARVLDLGERGQLELGQPLRARGGRREPPALAIVHADCSPPPCLGPDSSYMFDPPLADGMAKGGAGLGAGGRIEEVHAAYRSEVTYLEVLAHWRARLGPPNCLGRGSGGERGFAAWADERTMVLLSGPVRPNQGRTTTAIMLDLTAPRYARSRAAICRRAEGGQGGVGVRRGWSRGEPRSHGWR